MFRTGGRTKRPVSGPMWCNLQQSAIHAPSFSEAPRVRRSRSASSHGQWESQPSCGDIDLTWGGRRRPRDYGPARAHSPLGSATAGAVRPAPRRQNMLALTVSRRPA